MLRRNYQSSQVAPTDTKIVLAEAYQCAVISKQRIRWQMQADIFTKRCFCEWISKLGPAPNRAAVSVRKPVKHFQKMGLCRSDKIHWQRINGLRHLRLIKPSLAPRQVC